MGVKISLPPPGAGGPAGPDAGAVTREMVFVENARAGRARPLQSSKNLPAHTPQPTKNGRSPSGERPYIVQPTQSCRMASSALIFTALLAGRIPATRPTSVANTSAASISHGGIIEMVLPPPSII